MLVLLPLAAPKTRRGIFTIPRAFPAFVIRWRKPILVGTALVTFPVAGLMLLLGHPWSALFLAVWAALAVGLVDNLLRPMLIRGQGQLNGALVFFSLIGAMSAFGAEGLFVGPLALAFFLAVVRTRRHERETPAGGAIGIG